SDDGADGEIKLKARLDVENHGSKCEEQRQQSAAQKFRADHTTDLVHRKNFELAELFSQVGIQLLLQLLVLFLVFERLGAHDDHFLAGDLRFLDLRALQSGFVQHVSHLIQSDVLLKLVLHERAAGEVDARLQWGTKFHAAHDDRHYAWN